MAFIKTSIAVTKPQIGVPPVLSEEVSEVKGLVQTLASTEVDASEEEEEEEEEETPASAS